MNGPRKALAAFGLKKYQAFRLREWIRLRMGLVFDAYGGQGSGIFLELQDGQVVLLTARHVVAECIASGHLTLQSCAAPQVLSFAPGAILVHAEDDAALLYVPRGLRVPHVLRYPEWAVPGSSVQSGMPVVVSGGPGDRSWKTRPQVATRSICSIKILHYFTTIVRLQTGGLTLVCDVDETNQQLPPSFKGMSGGPAFTLDRKLIGIAVKEHRHLNSSYGTIDVLSRAAFHSLFSESVIYPGKGVYQGTKRFFWFIAIESKGGRTLTCEVQYMHCESASNPDAVDGRVAILQKLKLSAGDQTQIIIVDVLAKVALPTEIVEDWVDSLALRALRVLGLDGWDVDWEAMRQSRVVTPA